MKRKQAKHPKKNSESNDSEADPKPQKDNGGMGRENARNVQQGPRRAKEHTNSDEKRPELK